VAKTDDLIDRLVNELEPVAPGALGRMLSFALLPGFALSTILLFLAHGFRPDLAQALFLPAFWAKSIYPLALSIAGLVAMMVVARPGGVPRKSGVMSIAVYLVLVCLGLWQLHLAASADYPKLIFGRSYLICPFIIIATALPVFAANIWFLRRSAPTDPRLAGFVAGMTAGAVGAWIYSWGCIENGLTFIALWYTLGIVLMGIIGAAVGRRLLSW
jgi:hypothetical protein